jgi:hypothetical protein
MLVGLSPAIPNFFWVSDISIIKEYARLVLNKDQWNSLLAIRLPSSNYSFGYHVDHCLLDLLLIEGFASVALP